MNPDKYFESMDSEKCNITSAIFPCMLYSYRVTEGRPNIEQTRTSARYTRLVLGPAGGWGTIQTLLGANKYLCILIPTLSYPFIPIGTYNRSCNSSIWCYKYAFFG